MQNYIRDVLRLLFKNELENGDIEARTMGNSGTDIILSPSAKKLIPFDIEAKNQESIQIWGALRQCEANTVKDRKSLLVFKRNRTDTYVALKMEDFLALCYPDKNIPEILQEIKQKRTENSGEIV